LMSALLGLVMTDVGGFFRDGGFSRTDLAKVGKIKLTLQEFDPMYRRQLQSANIPVEQARQMGLANMILQQEITRQVLLQAADRSGIRISNGYIADHLKRELKNVPAPGSERDKLNAVLRNMGLSEEQFVNALRGDTSAHVLSSTISDQAKEIPDVMANAVAAAETQTRRAEIVSVSYNELPAVKSPPDTELESYLTQNRDRYEIPEEREIVIGTLKQDNLLPAVTIDDKAIEAYYQQNQDQFKTAGRAKFLQVIAPDEDTAKAVLDDAQKTSLTDAATKHKARLVASAWYDQGTLPNEIDTAVFASDKPSLLKPVKSPVGWHVIQTEEFKAEGVKELSEVKSTVTDLLKQEQTDKAVNDVTEEIEQQAADGTDIVKIVEPYKGVSQSVDKITRKNVLTKLGELKLPKDALNNLQDAVFTLNEGDVSPIIESKDGSYMLVQIRKVVSPHLPEFASVKDTLKTDWTKEQRDIALDKEVDDVIGDYDAKKPNLKVIAAENGHPYRETGWLKGDATDLPPQAMNILFNLSPKNDLTSVKTETGAIVVRLAGVQTDAPEKMTVTDKEKQDMSASLTQELQQQFVMGWRDYLGVDINLDLLNQSYLQAPAKE
ncbi:MAG TPA: peptidyl-prolyl cis-trans isomerase, partial [Alphaproteobacteria bacterium]